MAETKWGGWQLVKGASYQNIPPEPVTAALHVGPLPGRKQIALYIIEGGSLTPVAYFKDEKYARQTYELLGRLIGDH